MELVFREMQADEAKAVQRLGLKSFLRSQEGFYVTRPKTALVAVKDEEIVGGLIYAIENCGGKKLGFADFFFVKPEYAGQGIGRALCEKGAAHLWDMGCDYLATFVRDDNAGSWRAFEKAGLTRASLPKVASALGIGGFIKTYLKHVYGFGLGCDFYFAVRPNTPAADYSKGTGFGQMLLHIMVNLGFLAMLFIISGFSQIVADPLVLITQISPIILSFGIIFVGVIIFGYLGTLFSGQKWHYRMPSGGALLCTIIVLFGGFLPMGGNWYPNIYENTPKFRANMGASAALSWLYLLGLLVIARLFSGDIVFLGGNFQMLLIILIIIRCIPFASFSYKGGTRVFLWNKAIWAILVAASIFLIFFWQGI